MILTFDQLKNYRKQVAMVDGAFDPLHRGHIEYFRAAAEQLDVPLLCNVASDGYVRSKHPPLLPEDQRAAIVDAIRYISYTHVNQFDTETILRELQPKYYVKGKDWEGRLPSEQVKICGEYAIQVVYLNTVLDSSTRILNEMIKQLSQR
ncbi:MAG TPA: adenylyltransferase/cytidyltransferase family protein [Vicinamibacterales bacterium]|nr:adenylyltransferase/cytidyltransferase family protein [Vicinamibacterales bacterium]